MFNRKLTVFGRITIFGLMILSLLATSVGNTAAQSAGAPSAAAASALGNYAVVFVSRRIPGNGSVYYPQGGSLPGVQPYSRFQVASPGKLLVREANGALRTLIDGANPTAASLNLIDVNAPDVSYDGTKILFAGLPQGTYSQSAVNSPGAWRIYMINVDGTGLKQVTFSDRNINLTQFGSVASNFTKYDDTDPVWLPDGRIVFSSTRFPSFGQYGAALTSNLFVVNADGTNLHRITAERNGGERPVVDPLTGRIVYSRWWRNFRLGTNNMATMPYTEGYIMKDGVCALKFQGAECQEAGGLSNLERNSWHLAVINPDGTGLAQFAGRSMSTFIGEEVNHAYGGSFAADGSFYANFFPMMNGTEASGFGGIRRYQRGANGYTPIIGITTRNENILQFVSTSPTSYGVYVGNYAAEPAVLPDGTLLISWAANTAQDYGLYTINADGSGRTLVYDNPGTTEVRAKPIVARTVPPIIPDKVTQVASALPPLAQGPYNVDGNFTFKDLNVYFNAPVDTDIISAIPVGSASTIRFYTDFQRNQQRGSFEFLDWPILIGEVPVNPDGSLSAASPANIPLFEQIRTSQQAGYTIPLTGRGISPDEMPGAAHVAGMNFGRTGDVATCVGCHAGHSMIPVPANPADAQWTNLAPGATVTYSSLHSSLPNGNGAVDRKVKMRIAYNNHYRYWQSREGQSPNSQWLQLTFPVPVTVKTVRLYNIPASESTTKVLNTNVRLYSDANATTQIASANSGALSENGTDVPFNKVHIRSLRIYFTSVNGSTAGLGEVEVIASAAEGFTISGNAGAANVTLSDQSGVVATSGSDGTYSISVPSSWSGTITPTHACYAFTPGNRTYNNVTVNQPGQDYTATYIPSFYTITGNVGMAGVNLSYTDGTLKSVASDAGGNYSITVPCGWRGTITPSLTDASLDLGFIPASKVYTDVVANQSAQNYMPYRLFSDLKKWTTSFDLLHGWTVSDYVRTVGDVDGNGQDDVIGFGLDGVYVAVSNGSSFGPVNRWTQSFDLAHGWTVKDYVRTVGDVNGDGRADLVGFGLDGVYVGLSTGTGFDTATKWTNAFDLSHGWTVKDYVRTVGDVNGDGKADLVGFGSDGVYVGLSTGTGFGTATKWTNAFDLSHGWTVKDYVRTVGDINGDGKADLVGFGLDGVYVGLSTGTSFGTATKWTNAFDLSHGWTVSQYVRTVGDVNGDGKADLVGYGLDGVYVAVSTGTGFGSTDRWTTNFNYAVQGWRVDKHPRMLGDANGDGKADLIGFGADGVWVNK